MFYATKQNKYIVEGTAFELDGVQYPAVWLNQATPEQKAAIGLQEVVNTNSPADDRFYWVSENLDGAKRTYTNTPKDLDTLKETCVQQIKNTVYTLLQPTDYIDIRNLRDPNYKIDWMLWRESIRQTSENTTINISRVKTVDELINIVTNIDWPKDPAYVEPTVSVE